MSLNYHLHKVVQWHILCSSNISHCQGSRLVSIIRTAVLYHTVSGTMHRRRKRAYVELALTPCSLLAMQPKLQTDWAGSLTHPFSFYQGVKVSRLVSKQCGAAAVRIDDGMCIQPERFQIRWIEKNSLLIFKEEHLRTKASRQCGLERAIVYPILLERVLMRGFEGAKSTCVVCTIETRCDAEQIDDAYNFLVAPLDYGSSSVQRSTTGTVVVIIFIRGQVPSSCILKAAAPVATIVHASCSD
jgi:hypothetical protein